MRRCVVGQPRVAHEVEQPAVARARQDAASPRASPCGRRSPRSRTGDRGVSRSTIDRRRRALGQRGRTWRAESCVGMRMRPSTLRPTSACTRRKLERRVAVAQHLHDLVALPRPRGPRTSRAAPRSRRSTCSGVHKPITRDSLPAQALRDARWARSPARAIAASTRARRPALTLPRSFSTLDTVPTDTLGAARDVEDGGFLVGPGHLRAPAGRRSAATLPRRANGVSYPVFETFQYRRRRSSASSVARRRTDVRPS